MRDHLRSIPAAAFLTLADLPGIGFHSLQNTVRSADLPALEARPAISRDVEQATDFADTAALIARLDLVITVDTAVAHLAAALGKPVWIVLHAAPDWRWLTERTDSPWYPTVRLFRVASREWGEDFMASVAARRLRTKSRGDLEGVSSSSDGSWWPVLGRVVRALRTLAAS
jgi:hypothetical protein